jgi:hypothetical protein
MVVIDQASVDLLDHQFSHPAMALVTSRDREDIHEALLYVAEAVPGNAILPAGLC